jgi:hypothetical protein
VCAVIESQKLPKKEEPAREPAEKAAQSLKAIKPVRMLTRQ